MWFSSRTGSTTAAVGCRGTNREGVGHAAGQKVLPEQAQATKAGQEQPARPAGALTALLSVATMAST